MVEPSARGGDKEKGRGEMGRRERKEGKGREGQLRLYSSLR